MTKYKYWGQMCKRADNKYCYYRNSRKRFLECWTENEIQWALDHKFIRISPVLYEQFGESKYETYYEFTDKGVKWFQWYCWPIWFWIKKVIFKI